MRDCRRVVDRRLVPLGLAPTRRAEIVEELTQQQKIFHGADPIGKRLTFELRGHGAQVDQHPMWREVVGVLAVVASVASTMPGLRATRVNPIDALRLD